MKFFMIECPERKAIKALIEKHGGKMAALRDSDCIELVPYEPNFVMNNRVSHPVYSYTFIADSVTLKQLQSLKEYRMSRLATVKRPTRNPYRVEEDEKMKRYVDTHSGNPAVVKFWEDALNKGLDLDHTPDSLRHHWAKVLPNKTSPTKQLSIPTKRSEFSTPAQTPQKKFKEEKIKLPDADEIKSIRIVVNSSSRNVYDFAEINNKCEEEEIDQKFDKLVEICSALANKRLSKQEVLRALVARNGLIKATFEHFNENSQ